MPNDPQWTSFYAIFVLVGFSFHIAICLYNFLLFVGHACIISFGGYAYTDHINFPSMTYPDFEEDLSRLDLAKEMDWQSYGTFRQL